FGVKIDVAEELSRLATHLDEVERALAAGGAVGKRLDFLMQALNRETNTLGAQSVSKELSAAALEFKLLIEQMRAQVQSLEEPPNITDPCRVHARRGAGGRHCPSARLGLLRYPLRPVRYVRCERAAVYPCRALRRRHLPARHRGTGERRRTDAVRLLYHPH